MTSFSGKWEKLREIGNTRRVWAYFASLAVFLLLYVYFIGTTQTLLQQQKEQIAAKTLRSGLERLEAQLDAYRTAALVLYADMEFQKAACYGTDSGLNLYCVYEAHANLRDAAVYLDNGVSCGAILRNDIVLTNTRYYMSTDSFYGDFFSAEGMEYAQWREFLAPYAGTLAPARFYLEPESGRYEAFTYVLGLPQNSRQPNTLFFITMRVSDVLEMFMNEEIAYNAIRLYGRMASRCLPGANRCRRTS